MPGEDSLPTRVSLDAEGRVAEDLACVQCEYNLRTLHHGGRCPECGTEVVQSLRLNWLCYSDPKWLTRTATGLRQIVRMIGFALAWVSLMIIAAPLAMLAYPWHLVPPVAAILLSLVAACFVGVNVVEGVWRFTTPEPNRGTRGPSLAVRKFIRLGTAITAFSAVTGLVLLCGGWSEDLMALAGLASLTGFLCCHAAVLIYLRGLALRMSRPKEALSATIMTIGFIGGITLTLLGGLGQFDKLWAALSDWVFAAAGCLDIVLLIAFAVVANRFHVMLDAAARGIPETHDPGDAAALLSKTVSLIVGS